MVLISRRPFESADFKFDVRFVKFRAQISKYGHLDQKVSTFYSWLYSISKMLISCLKIVFKNFRPKSPNLDIFVQKVLTFWSWQNLTCALCRWCWFQICRLISVLLSNVIPRLHEPFFFTIIFFAKVSKYYGLNYYFLKVAIANDIKISMTLKKSNHILSL